MGGAAFFRAFLGAFLCCLVITPANARKISEKALRQHIEVLAADDMKGREAGGEAERAVIQYIASEFFSYGLVSGTNDPASQWFAPVDLVERSTIAAKVEFRRRGRLIRYNHDDIQLRGTIDEKSTGALPVVFVGRWGACGTNVASGDTATQSSNQFRERIALMLWSAPTCPDGQEAANVAERRERLFAQGARAVLVIADGEVGFEELSASFRRPSITLADFERPRSAEGLISLDVAQDLFRATRMKMEPMLARAASPDMAPVKMGITADITLVQEDRQFNSHNVIARLPGKHPELGAVLLIAHWDHLGEGGGHCAKETDTDRICNGAVDNASGVAALLEISRELARQGRFDRDIFFVATTGEEIGLLGMTAFATNPPVPLSSFVAAINMDMIGVSSVDAPIGIVGDGMTVLDADIAAVLAQEGVDVVHDGSANVFVERQDGLILLEAGVPTVVVSGTFTDPATLEPFMTRDYHRPSDELNEQTDLSGMVRDVRINLELVRHFADASKYSPPTP